MHPPFTLTKVLDSERLPTSSTCFSLLKLPDYPTEEQMYNQLLLAINTDNGFGLS